MEGAFVIAGFSFSGNAANAGMMFVSLKSSDQRRGKGHTVTAVVADLSPKLGALALAPNGGTVYAFPAAGCLGLGTYGGFEFMLQDRGAHTLV